VKEINIGKSIIFFLKKKNNDSSTE